ANSDCAACSSVAIAFPLPSTTGSGRVTSSTGEGFAGFTYVTLGFSAGAGLLDFSLTGFGLSCLAVAVRCVPDIVHDQLVRNWHSKDFIIFAFGNEFEITKSEIFFSHMKWRC
ncbi:hypothetical protein Tco_0776614, partial [Tanacetum coccineum]